MDEQKLTYEQFKADILQWKDAHREEYTRFAKMMADGNEMQYLAVCRAIFRQLPGIKKEWQIRCHGVTTARTLSATSACISRRTRCRDRLWNFTGNRGKRMRPLLRPPSGAG